MKLLFNALEKKTLIILSFLLVGCATYYQKQFDFQQYFSQGNLEKAKSFLDKNEKAAEKKDRLLYFFDRGVVEQMLGNYEESNQYFEKAYFFTQDFRSNFGQDLIGMTSNPMMRTYKGEDYELVLMHFYKAINFLQLNQLDAALVEVKRVNIKLNEINTIYESKKNRYKEDAFAHTLMGLIYEAKENYNDAFIAYRNAYNTFSDLYEEEFGLDAPLQLKKDLLRMAYINGFQQELIRYEEEFSLSYEPLQKNSGSLVFFWLNGLGPVKSEYSINLSVVKGKGGFFTFSNEQEGINIPYSQSQSYYNTDPAEFSDLKFVRMALPKFKVRKPIYHHAELLTKNGTHSLQMVQNIEEIAIATLKDRMLREIANSVGRLALKQATEHLAREKNEDIGTIVSIVNAATEKADTRNWQTLPHSIYYARVELPVDTHRIQLVVSSKNVVDTIDYSFNLQKNHTLFKTFHTLASTQPIEQ